MNEICPLPGFQYARQWLKQSCFRFAAATAKAQKLQMFDITNAAPKASTAQIFDSTNAMIHGTATNTAANTNTEAIGVLVDERKQQLNHN